MVMDTNLYKSGIFRQYVVAVISTISLFIGGVAIGWPNPAIHAWLSQDWGAPITRSDVSWILSIIHVAFIASSFPSGYLMDKFGELFPSNVKATASVVITIVLASSSFIINKMYLVLADYEGFYIDFIIFCVISLLGAVFTLTVVVETRGKTLQEIQMELNTEKTKGIDVMG